MTKRFNAKSEQEKKKRGNRYYYNAQRRELVECRVIENKRFSNPAYLTMPPSEAQLKLLDRLQLECIFYGIPCKLEFKNARTSRKAARSTISKVSNLLWRRRHGEL